MGRLKKAAVGVLVLLTVLLAGFILTKDSASVATDADQTADELVIQTAKDQKEPKNPLEKNLYPEINSLVRQYYSDVATGNMEDLQTITSGMEERFQQEIAGNQKFVEGYRNIDIYTKLAEEEDAYIVFVYYEMKIRDIDTPVPGLGNLYVTRNPEGRYIVANGIYDSKAQEYVRQVASDEDVQALVADVQKKYREVKESDDTLRLALDDLQSAYSE